jgi:hypothetical protein
LLAVRDKLDGACAPSLLAAAAASKCCGCGAHDRSTCVADGAAAAAQEEANPHGPASRPPSWGLEEEGWRERTLLERKRGLDEVAALLSG